MKLGIVSDTHDNLDKARKAVEFFEEQEVEKVIHCGDVVAPFTAELFDADFEFHYVRGNNEGEWNLKETVEEFGNFYNNVAEVEFEGKKIVAYHGTEEEIVEGLAAKDYDYVFRGHTHEKNLRDVGGTLVLNPGGIELPFQNEKLHVATVELKTGEVEFHRIE